MKTLLMNFRIIISSKILFLKYSSGAVALFITPSLTKLAEMKCLSALNRKRPIIFGEVSLNFVKTGLFCIKLDTIVFVSKSEKKCFSSLTYKNLNQASYCDSVHQWICRLVWSVWIHGPSVLIWKMGKSRRTKRN